jgi:hypothetical protein
MKRRTAGPLLPGLLDSDGLAAMISRKGIGKTPILHDFAVCAARGRQWLTPEIPAPRMMVTLVDLEGHPEKIDRSLRAIHHRVTGSPDLPANLRVLSHRTLPPAYRTGDSLIETVYKVRPADPDIVGHLVIFDHAAFTFRAIDRNRPQDVLALYATLREAMESAIVSTGTILAHNFRKIDSRYDAKCLITGVRDWIANVSGTSDLMLACDAVYGIEYTDADEDLLVWNHLQRGIESHGEYLERVWCDDADAWAGHQRASNANARKRFRLLKPKERELIQALPTVDAFSRDQFESIAAVMGYSRTNAHFILKTCVKLQILIRESRGIYRRADL